MAWLAGEVTLRATPDAPPGLAQPNWPVTGGNVLADGRTATRYVLPEMTGIEDLDSHGSWAQTGDYGTVWVPAVAPDRAPYRDGHWVWIAPWGWTWVDDASWGFALFHYGRWAMWSGRWCWVPGTYEARPVYAPALVAWSGPAPGVSVSVGAVGWFPLGPHEVYVPPYAVSPAYVRHVNATHGVVTANVHLAAPARYMFQHDDDREMGYRGVQGLD